MPRGRKKKEVVAEKEAVKEVKEVVSEEGYVPGVVDQHAEGITARPKRQYAKGHTNDA